MLPEEETLDIRHPLYNTEDSRISLFSYWISARLSPDLIDFTKTSGGARSLGIKQKGPRELRPPHAEVSAARGVPLFGAAGRWARVHDDNGQTTFLLPSAASVYTQPRPVARVDDDNGQTTFMLPSTASANTQPRPVTAKCVGLSPPWCCRCGRHGASGLSREYGRQPESGQISMAATAASETPALDKYGGGGSIKIMQTGKNAKLKPAAMLANQSRGRPRPPPIQC